MFKWILSVCLLVVLVNYVQCDTPANCTYEDIKGLWIFQEGPRGNDKTINCSNEFAFTSTKSIQLSFPNIATDEDGNIGFWTIIYNQGFEVVIHNRKYFAFSYYEQDGDNVTSFCDKTFTGWSHATGVNPSDWACYIATKFDGKVRKLNEIEELEQVLTKLNKIQNYKANYDLIEKINSVQSLWQASHYDFFEEKTIDDMIKMSGGRRSRVSDKPKVREITSEVSKLADTMPDSFDWTNVNGVNYVGPIRNQGNCGSCYAFAALAMNEARLRIKTNNTQQISLSPQDIVECSQYSQGCDGGFPYLISGKYGEDFGFVEEACAPYTGKDGSCSTKQSCTRHYSTNYHYVGGFYGACNEALMRIELVKNGPVVVAFEVYSDFFNYKGGVYQHTFMKDRNNFKFNPFQLTNHAVLLVGYGTTDDGIDFWKVRNSWGPTWGENGYFRILRGTNECAIESIAVAADIIV